LCHTLIGKKSILEEIKNANSKRDFRKIGSLLEYPDCCNNFFYENCLKNNCLDPTWDVALNSNKLEYKNDDISILTVPETNIFLSR
jgi:hypothetical protein